MIRKGAQSVVAGVAVLATVAFTLGGWAVITVEDLPDSAVAGQPLDLAFKVRQHGMGIMTDLRPVVEARSGDERVRAGARAGRNGLYEAALTLPESGEWSITIHSGFNDNRVTLLPMTASDSHSRTAAVAQPERGRRLFVAKGCLRCHVHDAVDGSGDIGTGPELTDVQLPAEYLARALADPAVIPRRSTEEMPDLDLKSEEIAALVAFLRGEARRADR
jgi:mono/diheme cytochrome c family protein